MKQAKLPTPPNPDVPAYRVDPLAFNRAMYDWAQKTKQVLERASSQNDSPLAQPFVIDSFTTNTQLLGTSSGTDVSNFVCTLVQALTNKGMITPLSTATG